MLATYRPFVFMLACYYVIAALVTLQLFPLGDNTFAHKGLTSGRFLLPVVPLPLSLFIASCLLFLLRVEYTDTRSSLRSAVPCVSTLFFSLLFPSPLYFKRRPSPAVQPTDIESHSQPLTNNNFAPGARKLACCTSSSWVSQPSSLPLCWH